MKTGTLPSQQETKKNDTLAPFEWSTCLQSIILQTTVWDAIE
jgi:hypothetical protein